MRQLLKWLNENRIASTVVGGVIVFLLTNFIFKLELFGLFKTFLLAIVSFFMSKYIITLWALVLMIILPALFATTGVVLLVRHFTVNYNVTSISFKKYVADIIFSILWHWQYIGNSIDDNRLIPLCPKCKRQLKERGIFDRDHERFSMECPNCDFAVRNIRGHLLYFETGCYP